MKLILLFIMIFCHIVDDYYLQGILAKMKQRKWWIENAPNPMYKDDYKVALIVHGFSWAFMTLLPLLVYGIINNYSEIFFYFDYPLFLLWNTFWHAYIDNEKANKLKINLITDQTLHLIQIAITYIAFLFWH